MVSPRCGLTKKKADTQPKRVSVGPVPASKTHSLRASVPSIGVDDVAVPSLPGHLFVAQTDLVEVVAGAATPSRRATSSSQCLYVCPCKWRTSDRTQPASSLASLLAAPSPSTFAAALPIAVLVCFNAWCYANAASSFSRCETLWRRRMSAVRREMRSDVSFSFKVLRRCSEPSVCRSNWRPRLLSTGPYPQLLALI